MEPDLQSAGAADQFSKGRLVQVRRGARTGLVRTANGRDIPFDAACLRVLGTERGFTALREGQIVGYDVGRAPHGLRVTTIRVYEPDADA